MVKIGLTNEAKKGSNRTFMELKFFLLFGSQRCAYRSNRTFMELKFNAEDIIKAVEQGSNRTFMELKLLKLSLSI